MNQDVISGWQATTEELITGMAEWRLGHPTATLKEIEQEIDRRLAGVRARMLADAAMASAAEEHAPTCPQCGGAMAWRGAHTRTLVTQHDREVNLKRRYAVCPTCGVGLFPPG